MWWTKGWSIFPRKLFTSNPEVSPFLCYFQETAPFCSPTLARSRILQVSQIISSLESVTQLPQVKQNSIFCWLIEYVGCFTIESWRQSNQGTISLVSLLWPTDSPKLLCEKKILLTYPQHTPPLLITAFSAETRLQKNRRFKGERLRGNGRL